MKNHKNFQIKFIANLKILNNFWKIIRKNQKLKYDKKIKV